MLGVGISRPDSCETVEYQGSAAWQRYLREEYGNPFDFAKWAIKMNENNRPVELCEWIVERGNEAKKVSDEHNGTNDWNLDWDKGWGLRPGEAKALIKQMTKDLKKAGLVTKDGLNDWVAGILEHNESDVDLVTETYDVLPGDREPVAFENTVQRRGSATAIYIPKAMEREAGISSGDLVAVTLLRVSQKSPQ